MALCCCCVVVTSLAFVSSNDCDTHFVNIPTKNFEHENRMCSLSILLFLNNTIKLLREGEVKRKHDRVVSLILPVTAVNEQQLNTNNNTNIKQHNTSTSHINDWHHNNFTSLIWIMLFTPLCLCSHFLSLHRYLLLTSLPSCMSELVWCNNNHNNSAMSLVKNTHTWYNCLSSCVIDISTWVIANLTPMTTEIRYPSVDKGTQHMWLQLNTHQVNQTMPKCWWIVLFCDIHPK